MAYPQEKNPRTNALAYFGPPSATKKKSFFLIVSGQKTWTREIYEVRLTLRSDLKLLLISCRVTRGLYYESFTIVNYDRKLCFSLECNLES
jgi:hypothetical protein